MAKRKALGKGLSALIPDANKLEMGEELYFQCPIEEIVVNPSQPRQEISDATLDELADSVREKGILTPLLVSKTASGYQLIAGERRWRAAQKAGLDRVPVVVREATPIESLELALIENIHREDLSAIEEAIAYKKLLEEAGITQGELAKRLGKDRSTVTNTLRLLTLPQEIQKDVLQGLLTMGHARVLAGVKHPNEQRAFRNIVLNRGLSVRQLEALVRKGSGKRRGGAQKPETDYYTQSLEERLKRLLGTKVAIKKRGRQGQIVIYFYSDEELDRLLELVS